MLRCCIPKNLEVLLSSVCILSVKDDLSGKSQGHFLQNQELISSATVLSSSIHVSSPTIYTQPGLSLGFSLFSPSGSPLIYHQTPWCPFLSLYL